MKLQVISENDAIINIVVNAIFTVSTEVPSLVHVQLASLGSIS